MGWRLRPRQQILRSHGRFQIRAEYREVLAQVESIGELPYGPLSVSDGRWICWRTQPIGQRLLTAMRAGRHQQFEEAAGPEQIEILGVQVRRVAKPIATLTAALPSVLDAGEPALVERGCSRCPVTGIQDAGMYEQNHDKGDKGDEQPGQTGPADHNRDGNRE